MALRVDLQTVGTGHVINLLSVFAALLPAFDNLNTLQVGGIGISAAQTRNRGDLSALAASWPPIGTPKR